MNIKNKKGDIYNILLRSGKYQKYTITLASITIIVLTWSLVFYFKMQSNIATLNKKLSNIYKQQETRKTCQETCEKIEKSINYIKEDIAQHTKNFRETRQTANTNISNILQEAKGARLTLVSCLAGEELETELYRKQKNSYEFSGEIAQIITFLNKIKRCNRMIECDDINITYAQDSLCNIKLALSFFDPIALY